MFDAQQTLDALQATQKPQPDPVRQLEGDIVAFMLGRLVVGWLRRK